MVAKQRIRMANEKHSKNITQRGNVAKTSVGASPHPRAAPPLARSGGLGAPNARAPPSAPSLPLSLPGGPRSAGLLGSKPGGVPWSVPGEEGALVRPPLSWETRWSLGWLRVPGGGWEEREPVPVVCLSTGVRGPRLSRASPLLS